MKKETGKSAMSKGKAKKPRRKVREMHIKPGHAGGYIVRHDEEPDPAEMMNPGAGAQESPQFPIQNAAALHAHIDEHMPEQTEEAQEGAAGAPGGGAGM